METRVTVRIDFAGGRRVGPGKIRLLELIDETGSISAAGRAMAMSYRRAWLLVDSLNTSFQSRWSIPAPAAATAAART